MQCLCGLWEVVVRGQEMMHDVLLHAYLTAPLHSSAFQEEHLGYLQFPGISGAIQKLFTRCQLRAGRRQRTGCVKEPSLWGRKMNFSIEEVFWGLGGFEVISEFCAELPTKNLLRTWAHSVFPRPYWVWIPVVELMGSSQWHKLHLPVNLTFIPVHPLHVCLILRCRQEKEAAEGPSAVVAQVGTLKGMHLFYCTWNAVLRQRQIDTELVCWYAVSLHSWCDLGVRKGRGDVILIYIISPLLCCHFDFLSMGLLPVL